MTDWIKWVTLFLQGKASWVIALAVAIIFFVPYEPFNEIRNNYPTFITFAGVLALSVFLIDFFYFAKDFCVSWNLKRKEKKEEEKRKREIRERENLEWKEFCELAPELQFFVLNLYFSSEKVMYVKANQKEILALLVSRYIYHVSAPQLDGSYQWSCDVALTSGKIEYIRKYRDQCRERWAELNNERIREEIESWRGRRSRFD